MSACTVTYQALVERALSGDPLDEHGASCASCQQRFAAIKAELGEVARTEPPPASEALVQRQIRAAMTQEPAQSMGSVKWALLGGGLLVAAAVSLFVLRTPSVVVPADHLASGVLQINGKPMGIGAPLVIGSSFEAREQSQLELVDGTTIALRSGSKGTYAAHLFLEQGFIELSVRPRPTQPLVIETPEATITVIGTRFSVERVATSTEVKVTEGIVEVRGAERTERLEAGRSWSSLPPAPPEPVVAVEPKPEPLPIKRIRVGSKRVRTIKGSGRAAEIRARLAAGNVAEARALLSSGGSVLPLSTDEAAELAILEAETRLQEGKGRHALQGYLEVVEKFPRSVQAEEALFAAAQLTLDYRSKADASAMLQRYLKKYPSGQFVTEAGELLRTVQGAP